jgi:hypothetical protein
MFDLKQLTGLDASNPLATPDDVTVAFCSSAEEF